MNTLKYRLPKHPMQQQELIITPSSEFLVQIITHSSDDVRVNKFQNSYKREIITPSSEFLIITPSSEFLIITPSSEFLIITPIMQNIASFEKIIDTLIWASKLQYTHAIILYLPVSNLIAACGYRGYLYSAVVNV
ncbi:hypothetical protein ACJX0J_029785, partial [Zea mays]